MKIKGQGAKRPMEVVMNLSERYMAAVYRVPGLELGEVGRPVSLPPSAKWCKTQDGDKASLEAKVKG